MFAIVGLILLLLAALVTIVGVSSIAGAAHPPTVFGHVTWSTGTMFLFGIVVGAVALLELIMLVAGARRRARTPRACEAVVPSVTSAKVSATPQLPGHLTPLGRVEDGQLVEQHRMGRLAVRHDSSLLSTSSGPFCLKHHAHAQKRHIPVPSKVREFVKGLNAAHRHCFPPA